MLRSPKWSELTDLQLRSRLLLWSKTAHIEAAGHGSIAIINRKKLEKQACACYVISKRFDAELGLRT